MNEHIIFDQHIKKIRLRLSSLSELISRQLSIISHYPRGHAYLLGGLGVCMLGLLALPSESSNAGPALTTLPVTSEVIDSKAGFESIAIHPQPAAAAALNPMLTLEEVDGELVEDLN